MTNFRSALAATTSVVLLPTVTAKLEIEVVVSASVTIDGIKGSAELPKPDDLKFLIPVCDKIVSKLIF